MNSNCVCCGDDYTNMKPTSYPTGAKSIPFVSEMQLLSKYGKQKIKLAFCDKHGNNLRACTRITNKGILQIRNTNSMRWNNAEKLGIVIV